MNDETTIIYYTDNSLEEQFAQKVRDYLIEAAGDIPIISVSQKPLDFGLNVCLGELGRSHLSMYRQILAGVEAATTKYVALAEHDCLYTKEHFGYVPSNGEFCYNTNHWFVQWNHKRDGEYSRRPNRLSLSQLICERELLIEAVKEKMFLLESGAKIQRGVAGACEPGVADNSIAFVNLPPDFVALPAKSKEFETVWPNLDIRHGHNFSGRRLWRGVKHELPYWGNFHQVMGRLPKGKWYQNVLTDVPLHSPHAWNSKFYNEGKWKTFIEPILPYKEGVFIEMGCNAGLYPKMAKQTGFQRVVGVEGDNTYFQHAHYYKSIHKEDIKLLHKKVGDNFNFNNIPLADVTLLANFHYWLTPEVLKEYIKGLRNKTLYCLMVSRKTHNPKQILNPNLDTLREYFKGWIEEKIVPGASSRGDPVPKRIYSVLYKNPSLKRHLIADTKTVHTELWQSRKFVPSYRELVKKVWAGEKFDITKTAFYGYCKWRRWEKRMGKKRLIHRIERWCKLAVSVRNNGIRDPLTMNERGIVTDGDHRLIIADMLNYKYVICKGA